MLEMHNGSISMNFFGPRAPAGIRSKTRSNVSSKPCGCTRSEMRKRCLSFGAGSIDSDFFARVNGLSPTYNWSAVRSCSRQRFSIHLPFLPKLAWSLEHDYRLEWPFWFPNCWGRLCWNCPAGADWRWWTERHILRQRVDIALVTLFSGLKIFSKAWM